MLSGDNGILQKATQSKEKTERAEIVENAKLDILAKISEKKGENLTASELEEILISPDYSTQGALSSEKNILERTLTSKDGKYEIPVSEIYNGSLASPQSNDVDQDNHSLTTGTLIAGSQFCNIIPNNAKSVIFTDVEVPNGVSAIDVSVEKNGSIMAWFDENTLSYNVSSTKNGVVIKANTNIDGMFQPHYTGEWDETDEEIQAPYLNDIIDLSNLDTSNVETMEELFYNQPYLHNITLGNYFNTNNVTNMRSMFAFCCSLESIDCSNFNTEKVTNMTNMFMDCRTLKILDLSSFDTKKVTQMDSMFYGCSELTTIYASNKFVTNQITGFHQMFQGTNKLVGGNGTNHIDGATAYSNNDYLLAWIDGVDGKLGLFTLKP